jgi:hypothetical protein
MRSIARVRWRKKAEHLTQAEQQREAEKHRQPGQALKQSEEGDWWAMRAMPAPQGVHPFQRLWPPIMIAVMFLLESVWIVFLVYLSVKFIRLYF